MKKNKKLKEYCVHITGQMIEVEGIMATSPEEAEILAMEQYNGGDFGNVGNIEVMRVCHCSKDEATDNDIDNKVCDNCEKKL